MSNAVEGCLPISSVAVDFSRCHPTLGRPISTQRKFAPYFFGAIDIAQIDNYRPRHHALELAQSSARNYTYAITMASNFGFLTLPRTVGEEAKVCNVFA